MSSANSSPTSSNRGGRKKTTRSSTARSLSASQIARDANHFETWSSRQNMDQVLFSDIPDALKADVTSVMNVKSKIPKGWLDSLKSDHKRPIPEYVKFLEEARTTCPDLFSSDSDNPPPDDFLYQELFAVFRAWKRLRKMKASGEKYSEADFAKAYDFFRSPAIVHSEQRAQCVVSLPQPLSTDLCSTEVRVLNAKTVIPDNLLLIPRSYISDLCESQGSPFKVLKGHKTVKKTGSAEKGSAFSFQSTPCSALPSSPGFEFVSSIWEDKKPVHPLLADAYRQNRMSIAASLRHLHSLGINLPVFGLVWADGTVRAHVDWCKTAEDESQTIRILSAPYPGPPSEDDHKRTNVFHEWRLENPAHILQVHFLIQNIDHWTCHGFKNIVTDGINNLKKSIVDDGGKYVPWRRVGVLKAVKHHRTAKELSATSNSVASTPPKRKAGRPRK